MSTYISSSMKRVFRANQMFFRIIIPYRRNGSSKGCSNPSRWVNIVAISSLLIDEGCESCVVAARLYRYRCTLVIISR